MSINAQGHKNEGTNTIASTSAELEDLVVTVAWQGAVVPDRFEVAVFDENEFQIDGQFVWSVPGEKMEVTFDNFLHNVPESGFQFSATVRDSAGRDVLQPHAFRVELECPRPLDPCQWRTLDGLFTNALATSEPLIAALDELETERSRSLLADILEEQPKLRGSVFTLAAQIDRLDRAVGLEDECVCAWHHSTVHLPEQRECERSGPGHSDDGSGSELVAEQGSGTKAFVAGQARHDPMPHVISATGLSRQTMELRCWKIHRWTDGTLLPLIPSPGMPPRTVRFPEIEACPDSCRGSVASSATIDYELATRVQEHFAGPDLVAIAAVDGFFRRDDGVNDPPKEDTWDASLHWAPPHTLLQQRGAIQIPTEGFFIDSNVRSMTITLSGRASIAVEAQNSWSYAMAYFSGTQLRAAGKADCAVLPDRDAVLNTLINVSEADDCGEAQIEPWEG